MRAAGSDWQAGDRRWLCKEGTSHRVIGEARSKCWYRIQVEQDSRNLSLWWLQTQRRAAMSTLGGTLTVCGALRSMEGTMWICWRWKAKGCVSGWQELFTYMSSQTTVRPKLFLLKISVQLLYLLRTVVHCYDSVGVLIRKKKPIQD